MAERLCEMAGGGNELTPTTLWTNSNPSTLISSAITVDLSQGVDDFDYIGVEYNFSTSDSVNVYEVMMSKSIFTKCIQGSSAKACTMALAVLDSSDSLYQRAIYYVSNTKVKIAGNCYYVGTTSKDNNKVIPTRIIGYK